MPRILARLTLAATMSLVPFACDDDEGDEGGNMCPAFCGQPYTCTQLENGQPGQVSVDVTLTWTGDECRPIPGNLVYTCDMQVTHEGEYRGEWTPVAGETFDVCIDPEFGGGCSRCAPKN